MLTVAGSGASVTFMAKLSAFFEISGVIFEHFQPYPLPVLQVDPGVSTYTMTQAAHDVPTILPMYTTMDSVENLTKFSIILVDGILHFIHD